MSQDVVDSNQQFFNATAEAVQLEWNIAEKVLGADELMKTLDSRELERLALDQLTDDTNQTYIEPTRTGEVALSKSAKLAFLQTAASQLAQEKVNQPQGYSLLFVELGGITLTKLELLEPGVLQKKITVEGDGTHTNLKQSDSVIQIGRTVSQTDSIDPELTLDDVCTYLSDYTKSARELLDLSQVELKALLEESSID